MMRRAMLVLLLATLLAPAAMASDEGLPYSFNPNLGDQASLQRGAKLFMNYCSGCHSLKYLRYNRLHTDLGIPEKTVEKNLIFSDAKIHDEIDTGLPARSSDWLGKAPPDLTLVTRRHEGGASWVYSFLMSFYLDGSRPNGVNNLVLNNPAMPDMLAPMQGYQKLETSGDNKGEDEGPNFKLVKKGSMTPEQYQKAVADIVNFLDYAGEPAKLVRYGLGFKVIIFLLIFTAFAWFLKREFWRDVH